MIVAAMLMCPVVAAEAHDFWINAKAPEGGVLKAEAGYGHHYPEPEPISEEELPLFDPLKLITPEGTTEMQLPSKALSDDFKYEVKAELKKGSYLVVGAIQPACWSNGEGGWKMQDRTQRPDASYVGEYVVFAKAMLNVEGSDEASLVTKPVGQRFEIVPQANPATVKAGDKLPLRVLLDGKPLKTAEVKATFAGFSDKGYKAFYGRTDTDGMIDFMPLKGGYWIVVAQHKIPQDKTRCDETTLVASLTFDIAE